MNRFIANAFGLILAIVHALALIFFILALLGTLSTSGNEVSSELQEIGVFGPLAVFMMFVGYVLVAGTLSVLVSKHELIIQQTGLLEDIKKNQKTIIRKLDTKDPSIDL